MQTGQIEDVSDTALMVAAYRAIESKGTDALFRGLLAGELTESSSIGWLLGSPSKTPRSPIGRSPGLFWLCQRRQLIDAQADMARMGSRENRNSRSRRAPCKGGAFQWVKAPPGELAPAGSNRSSHGGDEMAEAFG